MTCKLIPKFHEPCLVPKWLRVSTGESFKMVQGQSEPMLGLSHSHRGIDPGFQPTSSVLLTEHPSDPPLWFH